MCTHLETCRAVTVFALFALLQACTNTNIHETKQAIGHPCVSCHNAAFTQVMAPVHVGTYPDTCEMCHSTKGWIPAIAGHPEAKFPITTGAHANAAVGCTDCHLPSLGESTGGRNTDCIHCHIGAHTIPAIDNAHAAAMGYTPANAATPHSCLSCHDAGQKL